MTDTPQEVVVQTRWWPPSWLVATAFMAIVVTGIGGAFTFYEITDARRDARNACERSVGFREETRGMWLELFDTFPDSPNVPRIRRILEQRLPSLTCEGNNPIPVTPVVTLPPP